MTVRTIFVVLALLALSATSHGKEQRWNNFAEDGDLRYFLDQKTIVPLPDSVYLLWVKSVAKDKDFFKEEYNLNGLSYILTNYELDCAYSTYRVRGTIMFDKNRREINKMVNEGPESVFEPVPPESVLELIQEEICPTDATADVAESPEASDLPYAVGVPLLAVPVEEPPTLQ